MFPGRVLVTVIVITLIGKVEQIGLLLYGQLLCMYPLSVFTIVRYYCDISFASKEYFGTEINLH